MLFPTGFAANLGVLTTFGGPGTLVCSDELNHASIIDGTRLAKGEVAVYPHRDLDALDTLLRERDRRPPRARRDRHRVLDGRRRRRRRPASPSCARHHGALLVLDEAHAVLGPDLADPGPPVLRVGTLSKTLGALGGFVAGPRRAHRARREPRPLLHLHHRDVPGRRRRRARRGRASCASSEGDDAAGPAARQRRRAARPATRRRSCPVLCGDEARALDAAPRRCSSAACSSRRSDRRPCRPAPRACGSRSRPRTRSTRSRTLRDALDGLGLDVTHGLRHRDRDRGRQDLVGLARRSTCSARRGVAVAVRKPAQSYAPDELGSTDAELLGRASGEPAETVCPTHRWYPIPMAPPMAADALGSPPFTIADLVGELRTGARPTAITIVEGAGGPRSPLAADGDSVDLAVAIGATVVVLVAAAGLGTINAVRLCAPRRSPAGCRRPAHRGAQPLRRRRRPAPRATTAGSPARASPWSPRRPSSPTR